MGLCGIPHEHFGFYHLDQRGGDEKDSGYICKGDLVEFVDRLDVGCEKK